MGFDITGFGAVGEMVGKIGGKLIDRLIPDPEQKAKALLELEQMKQSGELSKMANETKLYEIEVDDRKSARTIHTSFVDFLSVILFCGCGFLIYHIMTQGFNKGMDSMVAGMITQAIISIPIAIIAYYYGSSSGSKAKNEAINQALKNK